MKKKIPNHAKRVFKGVIYDVYHWEQEMFDGSFTTFEMLKRPDTVITLAFDEDGDIYYARQAQPNYNKEFFSLFGGRADEGESALEAAKRELKEETGMESNKWTEFKTFHVPGKIDWNICYFIAKDCQKVAEPALDSGEKIEIIKTSFDDFIHNVIPHADFRESELKNVISDFSENKKEAFKSIILDMMESK